MNLLWFKRDLRLFDNEALVRACEGPFIAIYIFEPIVEKSNDWNIRHWRFVFESLQSLISRGLEISFFYGDALEVFKFLSSKYDRLTIYSHEESGNAVTYQRDIDLRRFIKKTGIRWYEFPTNLVIRGIKNRANWDSKWDERANKECFQAPDLSTNEKLHFSDDRFVIPPELIKQLETHDSKMLLGGEDKALHYLNCFFEDKVDFYFKHISYPELSRHYCSLLSAYISWGNISIRKIYQECLLRRKSIKNKRSLDQFMSRLKWHCHFVQKFEMQPEMEFKNLNPAFDSLRPQTNHEFIKKWKSGHTGYPLIDAAMRCVSETGYLNFRLRATVISFLTHLLWQPWQSGAKYLASMFLDYEPGIHFPQVQMQAGTTGINRIRIYNPIKQSKEKDPEGVFIKKWLPELRELPNEYIHTPWEMTDFEQILYDFKLGLDYPEPIVQFSKAYTYARDELWRVKRSVESQNHSKQILLKHVR